MMLIYYTVMKEYCAVAAGGYPQRRDTTIELESRLRMGRAIAKTEEEVAAALLMTDSGFSPRASPLRIHPTGLGVFWL